MNTKKIVYFQQDCIPSAVIQRIQDLDPGYDHDMMKKILQLTINQSLYTRMGSDFLPFRYNGDFFNDSIPDYNKNFKKTYEEITDQRCMELLKTCQDRPWIVLWSGGIDSTVILSSLIKNASRQQLKNITVSLNFASVYENPKFFYDYVKPNFKIINSTNQHCDKYLNNYYLIDGNPADMLQGSGLGLQGQHFGLDLSGPWQNNSGLLLDFLSRQVGTKGAEWLVERMEKNINSISSEKQLVETLSDWFWWINFNWKWSANRLHAMDHQNLKDLSPYFKSFKNWYDTTDYQIWSITSGRYSLINDGSRPGDYKKPSKQYIYDLDKNDYYYKFKSKSLSTARQTTSVWQCVLDDATTLTVDRDLDLILELLPSHLNLYQ